MKVSLFGLGHLGKIHLNCLAQTPFELVGAYDPAYTQDTFDTVKLYSDAEKLLAESDACIIAAPTVSHCSLASLAISKGKHCFIEKPLSATIAEADELSSLATQNPQLITQVGFVERYNPAYKFVESSIKDPKFIEVHRLAQFNNRGNDVSVVFDLMIHDLDLLLNMKQAEVKEIKATGVKILTESLDICNCRIEFEDRSVANLTSSRMSMKVMRKFRIFQEQSYVSIDLHKKESQVINLSDKELEESMMFKVGDKEKHLVFKSSGALEGNAIVDEQLDFYNSIINQKQSKANIHSAAKTSRLAQQIEDIALDSII